MRICSPSFQLFLQQWEEAILQLNPSANTATFPSHCVKGPEEEKQQTQTQNVNPLIICERKDGFDAAFIQITEPELTSEKKYGGIFASPPPPPLHFNLLQSYSTARVHSTWKTPLPKPLSSRWSGIKRLPHTHVGWNSAHTCSPPSPLLFSLSAKGKASKQVKALSQLLFSWLIHF